MSFILDALRKSDSERQQQAEPGLASTMQRREPNRRGFWIPLLVIGALAVNALGWLLLRDDDPVAIPPTPAETATRSLRKEPAPLPVPPPAQPSTPATVTEPVAKNSPPQLSTPRAAPAPVEAAQPATPDLPTPPARTRVSPTAAAPSPTTNEASLPSFEQLLVAGVISSRQLHLDIHVFAPESAKRFVFINMSKYREGQQLDEGPVLETITETGVILTENGQRFTLKRN